MSFPNIHTAKQQFLKGSRTLKTAKRSAFKSLRKPLGSRRALVTVESSTVSPPPPAEEHDSFPLSTFWTSMTTHEEVRQREQEPDVKVKVSSSSSSSEEVIEVADDPFLLQYSDLGKFEKLVPIYPSWVVLSWALLFALQEQIYLFLIVLGANIHVILLGALVFMTMTVIPAFPGWAKILVPILLKAETTMNHFAFGFIPRLCDLFLEALELSRDGHLPHSVDFRDVFQTYYQLPQWSDKVYRRWLCQFIMSIILVGVVTFLSSFVFVWEHYIEPFVNVSKNVTNP